MALPQGIDFRKTAGYVTDPANCTYDTVTFGTITYPRTTPQGNTVGWEQGPSIGGQDSSASAPDPRLAGFAQTVNTSVANFRIDLPAPGSYLVNLAAGTYASGPFGGPVLALYDNATLLATIDNGTVVVPQGSYLDAAANVRTATDWIANNTPLAASFGSTILRAKLGDGVSSRSALITHLFVQTAGGPTAITISQATILWRPVALTTNAKTQTTLAQAPLRWSPRALAVNAKTQTTISRQPWAWAPRAAGVNQTTQITPPTRAWKWSASPVATNQRTQRTLAQAAWRWAARALEITQPTLLTFARVAWFWRGRKLPGYGNAALSQVQGLVSGFVRKFVSGFDETPPE